MTSRLTGGSLESTNPPGIGSPVTDIECSHPLEEQIDFILAKFSSLVGQLNGFLIENFLNISEGGFKPQSFKVLSLLVDSKREFAGLAELLVAQSHKRIPFQIVEIVGRDDPLPEPAALTRYIGDQPSTEDIPQEAAAEAIPDIEDRWNIRTVKTPATPLIRPFRMQFTPSTSISGGPPEEGVDFAMQTEFLSADKYTYHDVPPSVFMSETYARPSNSDWATPAPTGTDAGSLPSTSAASTAVPPPAASSSMTGAGPSKSSGDTKDKREPSPGPSTSKRKRSAKKTNNIDATRESGSTPGGSQECAKAGGTSALEPMGGSDPGASTFGTDTKSTKSGKKSRDRPSKALRQRQKRLELPLILPPPDTDPLAEHPRPFHQHEVWPVPGAVPRQLRRSGAFYHKTHPNIWWMEEWGDKPKPGDKVKLQDILPPWTWKSLERFNQDRSEEEDSQSESDSDVSLSPAPSPKKDKGKGKAEAKKEDVLGPSHVDQPSVPEEEHATSAGSKLRSRKEGSSARRLGLPVARKAAGTARSASGTWTGIRKTLRSVAAAVSGAVKETGSRDGLRSTSQSSSNPGPHTRGNKKRRRDPDDEEDGGDNQAHTSMAKKLKRSGRR